MAPKRKKPAATQAKASGRKEQPEESTRDASDSELSEERRHAGTDSSEDEHERPSQPAKRQRKQPGDNFLLGVCKEKGADAQVAAQEWVERYKEGHNAAVAELLTLIVRAAGSSYTVSEEEVEEGEIDKLVSAIRSEIDQEGFSDLFKSKAHKHFSGRYMGLWDDVIQRSSDADILYGTYLLEPICHLLTGLSSSDIRCLRFVGTLTACQVATALIKAIVTLTDARATAERQHAAEARKKASKAQERAAAFKRTSQMCHSHINELEIYVNSIFQGVTTNRFRDVDEEIREIVIDGIGNWAFLHPAGYLRDLYLKYIAWALSDRAPGVREAAVEAIIGILAEEDNLPPIREVISRFKSRLLQLPDDVSDHVAIKAVKLLTRLVKLDELPHSEVSNIFQLLLEDSAELREAAAELVSELVEECGRQFLLQSQAKQKSRRKSIEEFDQDELQLAGLLHIMNQLRPTDQAGDMLENAAVNAGLAAKLVDILFDRVAVLRSWQALTDALLDDAACEKRGSQATSDVTLLLQAAVQKGCGGQLGFFPLTAHPRKGVKAKLASAMETNRHNLTIVMSRCLLSLLRKFQGDPVKAAALVSTIESLKVDIFSIKQDERSLEDILKATTSIIWKHADEKTAQSCIPALVYCANPSGNAPQDPGIGILVGFVAELAKGLSESSGDLLGLDDRDLAMQSAAWEGNQLANECDDVFFCRISLVRLEQLLLVSPIACENVSMGECLTNLIKAAVGKRPIPTAITELALKCQAVMLLWQLQQQLEDDSARFQNWPSAVSEFVEDLTSLLERPGGTPSLKAAAIFCLADLTEVFRPGAFLEREDLQAVKPTVKHAELMWAAFEEVWGSTPAVDDNLDDLQIEALKKQRAATKNAMLAGLGRLVVRKVEPLSGHLAGKILSCLESEDETAAAICRDVHQQLKKLTPGSMPKNYTVALEALFQRPGSDSEQLMALGKRIAGFNSALVAGGSNTVCYIMEAGLEFATKGAVPERIPFLKGILPLVSRLPLRGAEKVAAMLKAAVSGVAPDPQVAEWEGFFDLQQAIEDRISKFKAPKGALKKPGSAGKPYGRRISFRDEEPGKKRRRDSEQELEDDSGGSGSDQDMLNDRQEEAPRTEAQLPKLAPRFHTKTRRGSQHLASSPAAEAFGGEQQMLDASPPDSGLHFANSAEEMPSGLFIAGADGAAESSLGISDRRLGNEQPGIDEGLDEESEDEMPRVRPRRA